ncbi:MAG: HAMP domain-containing protein [Xanthomonadales bacterium]|nr:HAMP domain-containing protein [Xanthomonadales bacterium]NIX11934.1 HAMP domain-containing protein [Xanthomonadales bacterium]
MKTVFSKILVALAVTVVLALAVVTVMNRVSLKQGFMDYLEQQESEILASMAPALADLYRVRGGWEFLRDNPRDWERIWRWSGAGQAGGPGGGPGEGQGLQRRGRPGPAGNPPPPPFQDEQLGRWIQSLDRPMFRQRLYLLDEQQDWIAGASAEEGPGAIRQPIELDGAVVGWIGFGPMGDLLPPDAERFLEGQVRVLVISLSIALAVAAVMGYLLARHLGLPVARLSTAVDALTEGRFETRADIATRDEIGRLGKSVNELAETLEKSRSARQRWTADIAHELRTPVSVMKGEIEALADGVRQADERLAVSLGEEIDQLASLVDDLQTLALSDAGALNLVKEPVDLSGLAVQSADAFHHRLAGRSVRLAVYAGEGIEACGDPQRLKQLLHNLLENSCRYVEHGGQVSLSVLRLDDGAGLEVADSGPGVSDEQLARLFERFYRAEGSRSRATGGSGLGLAICRNIVEAHGGTIDARHSELGGLSICVTLPCPD